MLATLKSFCPTRATMRLRLLTLALIPLVAVACVSANATLINPSAAPYPAVAPDSVVIYTSMSELEDLEYERIAIIEASGSGDFTDQADMLEAMREKAGEVGANGLLLPDIEEPGAGARVAAAVFGTDTTRTGSVIAIRVIGPAAPD